jgi:hypothetical protein
MAISLSDDTTTSLREKKRCVEKIIEILSEIERE